LDELNAICSEENKLIDENRKEIIFYQLTGCWGVFPLDGEEKLQKQEDEIKKLKEQYNIIEMTCNPGEALIP
jgi:hypothetical protein